MTNIPIAGVMRQTLENQDEFVWEQIPSVERLGEIRMAAMRDFLSDYPIGSASERYLPESAPFLSLPDDSFDLALCSHFLFLYSSHLDLQFHIDSISELCRVSREVRLFPLLQLGSTISPYVGSVIEKLQADGYEVSRVRVDYEFQRGGNEMLQIKRAKQTTGDNV